MIKQARHVEPGDVILYNGKASIVEYAYTVYFTRKIKLHNNASELRIPTDTSILVSDTYKGSLPENVT